MSRLDRIEDIFVSTRKLADAGYGSKLSERDATEAIYATEGLLAIARAAEKLDRALVTHNGVLRTALHDALADFEAGQ